jgi:hypothetical protein
MPKESSTKKNRVQTPKTIADSTPQTIPDLVQPSTTIPKESTLQNTRLNFFQLFWKLKVFLITYILYNLLFGLISFGTSGNIIYNNVFYVFGIGFYVALFVILGIEIHQKLLSTKLINSWIVYLIKVSLFLGLVFSFLEVVSYYILESSEGSFKIQNAVLVWLSALGFNFFLVGIVGSVGVFLDSMIINKKIKTNTK